MLNTSDKESFTSGHILKNTLLQFHTLLCQLQFSHQSLTESEVNVRR